MTNTSENTEKTIYEDTPKVFAKRLLSVFGIYCCIWTIFFILPLFFDSETSGMLIFWWIIITVAYIIVPITFSVKWTQTQLISVIKRNNILHFIILDKNRETEIEIEVNDLRSQISWTKGRPKSLILTIYDKENKAIRLYSTTKRSLEFMLEDLHYKLNQEKKQIKLN